MQIHISEDEPYFRDFTDKKKKYGMLSITSLYICLL